MSSGKVIRYPIIVRGWLCIGESAFDLVVIVDQKHARPFKALVR
jgi:hypothetical protein